jgi:hypothetical protein
MKLGLNVRFSFILLSHLRASTTSLNLVTSIPSSKAKMSTTSLAASSHPGYSLLSGALHPPIGYGTYKIGYIPPTSAAALSGEIKSGGSEEEDPR